MESFDTATQRNLIILRVLSMYTEIRVSNEAEEEGLDIHEHNEQGYSL